MIINLGAAEISLYFQNALISISGCHPPGLTENVTFLEFPHPAAPRTKLCHIQDSLIVQGGGHEKEV